MTVNIIAIFNGTHTCELNNSTHMEHDADLSNDPVFYYRGAKVMTTSQISNVLVHLFVMKRFPKYPLFAKCIFLSVSFILNIGIADVNAV